MGAQPHPYWQHQYLHRSGLPTSTANVTFLTDWGQHANSGCDYNALDLSHREPGSTRCQRLPNGKYARSYTDTQSAATAFADQLYTIAYPNLRGALFYGDPYHAPSTSGIASELQEWGSVRFEAYFATQAGQVAPSGGRSRRGPKSKNVGGAWSHLMRTLAVDGHRTIVELHKATADLNRISRRLRRA